MLFLTLSVNPSAIVPGSGDFGVESPTATGFMGSVFSALPTMRVVCRVEGFVGSSALDSSWWRKPRNRPPGRAASISCMNRLGAQIVARHWRDQPTAPSCWLGTLSAVPFRCEVAVGEPCQGPDHRADGSVKMLPVDFVQGVGRPVVVLVKPIT